MILNSRGTQRGWRLVYRADDAPGLASQGWMTFTILAKPALGTVSYFAASLTIEARKSDAVASYLGEVVSYRGLYDAGVVSNVVDGGTLAATLIYDGHRRGLHVLRTTMEVADGYQEEVCATGAREGWRLPTLGEAAGLLSDDARVECLGFGGVERGEWGGGLC